jgi:hypothetical protein
MLFRQDDRHPGVDLPHKLIRLASDDPPRFALEPLESEKQSGCHKIEEFTEAAS